MIHHTKKYWGLILVAVLCSFTVIFLKNWEIAEGYTIRFDGKFAHGTFDKLSGSLSFDPENLAAATFDVTVDVASINTGIELKNKHAKSDKWFDAEKYPVIHFISTEILRADTSFIVRGDLEMHGIRKSIEIPFSFRRSEGQALFQGQFRVNRGDFGIGKYSGKASDSTNVEILVPVRAL